MIEHDDEGDDALCTELRAEARALRAAAPRDLAATIEAALAGEPAARSSRRRAALLAAAACLALAVGGYLAALLDEERSKEPVVTTEPGPSSDLLAALPRSFGRDINLLGASLEQPLRAELDSLAYDSRLLAETVLGGVPSPVRRLLGLP